MPHQPPKDVQEAAQRAQRWIEEGRAGKGFTDVGRDRAHQLAQGEAVPDAHPSNRRLPGAPDGDDR